ncbi:MAG: phosphotransferase [Granulosicoccus sp.]|nr:phosphotransferase [Granulosicoccus sp.]
MHDIPVSGYGRLENSTDKLTGSAQSAEVGLQMRYEAPWPFTFESLDDHPTVRALPSLKPKIHRMESDLLSFEQGSKPAINHSDLHEGQLLVSADSLTALLDFNDAFVGRREWDLGSYLYFHGSKCLGDLLDGYCRSTDDRSSLTDQAALASVLIALHHGNRGAILGRPHRIEASVKYLSCMFL